MITKTTDSPFKQTCTLCNAAFQGTAADISLERRVHWSGAEGFWIPVLECPDCRYGNDVELSLDQIEALVNRYRLFMKTSKR